MKTTAASVPLSAVASSVVAESTNNSAALWVALVLVACSIAMYVGFVVLFVLRPGDRQDLLELIRTWQGK